MLHPLATRKLPEGNKAREGAQTSTKLSVVGLLTGVSVPPPEERRAPDDHHCGTDADRQAGVGTAVARGLDRLIREVLRSAVADLRVTLRCGHREEAEDERRHDRNEEEQRQLHTA